MQKVKCKVLFSFNHKGKNYAKGDPIELNEQDAAKLVKDGMIQEGSVKEKKSKSKEKGSDK